MIIVGAKGFAKEVLEIFEESTIKSSIAFYDDINKDIGEKIFGKFLILKDDNTVISFFKDNGNDFTIGVGNPKLRLKLYNKFMKLGGNYISSISSKAKIGSYDIIINEGANILSDVNISNSVKIGKGCIIYYGVIITHDCLIGDFAELSPNVILLGGSKVGNFTQIGANSTILPNITIGDNVIIGAGSVVTKDIPNNTLAYGSPARVIKVLDIKD
jgi:sugar O-acyltransferase (sialic acid O-acetyltransferase NeuD family)